VTPYRTVMRHPDEWCPGWEHCKDDNSPSCAGRAIVVDVSRVVRRCLEGHRCFPVLEYGDWPQGSASVCEMNIVIGD
jgi:hypothetical protein